MKAIPTYISSLPLRPDSAKYDIKKIIVVKAQGLIPSINPATTIAKGPKDLNLAIMLSFALERISAASSHGHPVPSFSYCFIKSRNFLSVISSFRRCCSPRNMLGSISRFFSGTSYKLHTASNSSMFPFPLEGNFLIFKFGYFRSRLFRI